MLHMKQLNRKKTRFSRFDKILVIKPISEMYGKSNERQLCLEIGATSVRSKNIFTDISRYPTGEHEIKKDIYNDINVYGQTH